MLCKALEEISSKKKCQEELLSILVHALQSYRYDLMEKGRQYDAETEVVRLFAKYQLLVSSVLMATLPRHFPGTYSSLVDLTHYIHHSLSFVLGKEFFNCQWFKFLI